MQLISLRLNCIYNHINRIIDCRFIDRASIYSTSQNLIKHQCDYIELLIFFVFSFCDDFFHVVYYFILLRNMYTCTCYPDM